MTTTLPIAIPKETLFQQIEQDAEHALAWFECLFDEAEKLYNSLSADEQAAAVWGKGIITIIAQDLNALPPDVIALIQKAFPTLDLSVVQGFLDELLTTLDVANFPTSLEAAIEDVQAYLKQHTGGILEAILNGAATILSVLFSPETLVAKFINIATYVEQAIVGPHLATVQAA